MAEDAHCSHSTIAAALAGRQLPTLRTLLGIVEALDGDGQYFVDLYEKTSEPQSPPPPSTRMLLTAILEEARAIHALMKAKGAP